MIFHIKRIPNFRFGKAVGVEISFACSWILFSVEGFFFLGDSRNRESAIGDSKDLIVHALAEIQSLE